MPRATRTTIQCANCRQPVPAIVESIIDAAQDPQAKVRLLTGRLNVIRCPNCGAPNTVLTPLLYHDPNKELLIAYIPMELGLPKETQEKAIGDMMRELTGQLPQGAFKGYMFQPRQALSMQGLIDQILQADGVTPEMMEEQRERVRLVEMFLQTPEENLPALVEQYDDQIDARFFQTMTLMMQQLAQDGRPDVAQQLLDAQSRIAELSTFGRQLIEQELNQEAVVREVADAINQLGEQAQRSDFLDLALQFAGDDQRLQALVGLVRPVMDYTFFQELTMRIGQAPADERETLEALRDRLLELTAMVDQQTELALQGAARLLQTILVSDNPDEIIRENLPVFDYTFMQVLAANIQEAERQGDVNAAAKLKNVYERIVSILQEAMPPELRFINELLSTQSEEDARALIADRAPEFGEPLLEAIDVVEQQLAGRSDPALLQKLAFLREATAQALG
jgi:hypothetical protein